MAQMYLNAFSVPGNMLRITKNVEMLYYNCENTDYSYQVEFIAIKVSTSAF